MSFTTRVYFTDAPLVTPAPKSFKPDDAEMEYLLQATWEELADPPGSEPEPAGGPF
jgi:hypothetical protein